MYILLWAPDCCFKTNFGWPIINYLTIDCENRENINTYHYYYPLPPAPVYYWWKYENAKAELFFNMALVILWTEYNLLNVQVSEWDMCIQATICCLLVPGFGSSLYLAWSPVSRVPGLTSARFSWWTLGEWGRAGAGTQQWFEPFQIFFVKLL